MLKKIIVYYKLYSLKKILYFSFIELYRLVCCGFICNSYSQKKEDVEIDRLLNYKSQGFYVDVGANDPSRFNNTKRFYKKGWSGINIEPNKSKYLKFNKVRPRDINLNMGVATTVGTLPFFQINVDTLSTFSKEMAGDYELQGYQIISISDILVDRLGSLLATYAKDKNIDFFSIDTEGFDMEVLSSNDWKQFRPTLICIESICHDINEKQNQLSQCEFQLFLSSIGYKNVYDNGLNAIYKDNQCDSY